MAGSTIGVKVQIEGAGEFKKDMQSMTAASKALSAEMKSVEASFDKQTTVMQKSSQQRQILSQQIDVQKQKMSALSGQIEKASAKYGEGSKYVNDLKKQYYDAATAMNKMKAQMENLPNTVQAIGQQMQITGQKISDAGKKISSVGQSLTTKLTLPLAAVGAASVKYASDFYSSMAKVGTIADTSTVSIDSLKGQIMDLSSETGVAASDIAQSTYDAISAGQSTEDSVNAVAAAIKLAKGGFTDTATAMDVLTTTQNAYGKSAGSLADISDKLITTQNLGKTTVAQLGTEIGNVIPTANMYHVSLDNLSAGYVALTKNGVNTATSTTALNAMIQELGKSGTTVSDILKKKTGKSFSELMDSGMSLTDVLSIIQQEAESSGESIGDMFSNKRSITAAATLTQHTEDFTSALDAMGKSAGAAQAAFDKMEATPAEQMAKALNDLKNDAIDIGNALMPVITQVVGKIRELAQEFSGLSPEEQQVVAKAGLLAAALGPVVSVVGKTVTAIGELHTGLGKVIEFFGTNGASIISAMSSPLGLLALGIGGVTAAVIALGNAFGTQKSVIGDLSEQINNITSTAENAQSALSDTMSSAADSVAKAEAQSEMASGLVTELEALAGQSNRTAGEQARMKQIVSELNAMFPELGASIDSSTGELNMSAQAIEDYVNNASKMQLVQAYAEASKDAWKAVADASVEATQNQNTLDGLNSQVSALQKQADAIKNSNGAMVEFNGKTTDSQSAIMEINGAITATQGKIDDANAKQKELNDAVDAATQKAQSYSDAQEQMEEKLGMTSDAEDNVASSASGAKTAIDDQGTSTEENSEKLAEFKQKLQEVASAYESLYSSVQTFGQLDGSAASIDDMNAALQSQVEVLNNYQTNIGIVQQAMSEMDANTQAAAQSFLSSIASMGTDGAGYLQALVNAIQANDGSAQTLLANFADAQNAKNTWATTLAGMQTDTESGMLQIAQAVENGSMTAKQAWEEAQAFMNQSTKTGSSQIQASMSEGVAQTNSILSSGAQELAGTAGEAGDQASSEFSNGLANGQGSAQAAAQENASAADMGFTSLEAFQTGHGVGMDYASGLNAASDQAEISGNRVKNNAENPLKNSGASAFQWGSHLGQNFARGIASTAGAALSAATSIANAVHAVLHHTTPDEGPLKDDDKWGAELGQNFANGIRQTIPDVSNASNDLAQSVYDSIEKTTGTEKEKVAKSIDDIESEFISAAGTRINELKKANRISNTEIGQFWKSVANKCRKGSLAYYQAMQSVADVSDDIDSTIISSAKEALERQETYHGESIAQEVEYWDKIRKVLKEGTDARYEADKEYLSKKQALNEKLQSIEDSLTQSLEQSYKSIRDSFGLFDDVQIDKVADVDLIDREKKQAAATQQYADALEALSKKKIPADLMSELMQTSVDDVGYLQKLLSYSDDQLDEYVTAWRAKTQAAAKAALLSSKDDIKSAISDINSLMGDKGFVTAGGAIAAGMDIGTNMVSGIIKSFTENQGKLVGAIDADFWKKVEDDATYKTTETATNTINTTTQVVLPLINDSMATVMDQAGTGIADNAEAVTDEVQTVSDDSLDIVSTAADYTYSYGAEFGINMAAGIRSQIAAVRAAAEELAAAAAGPVHHSTPDYGPLKGDDKWGAEMVQGFADSMLSKTADVQRASLMVARAAAFSPTASAQMYGAGNSSAISYGGFNISVYAAPGQNVNDIANAVASKIQKSIRRREAVG